MPKFGLKYFLGSFLLSLVTVFAATKAYVVLSAESKEEQAKITADTANTHNIELLAVNEENDPLYEKFNQLQHDNMNGLAAKEPETTATKDMLLLRANTINDNDGIMIADESLDTPDFTENTAAEYTNLNQETADTTQAKENDELVIADAAEAKDFSIPLLHHFTTENGTVSISNRADENQIAMASHDVVLDNLGADNKAAATQEVIGGIADFTAEIDTPDDSPWEVAETANAHIAKNTLSTTKVEKSTSVSAMDKSNVEVAENNDVPYKMQQNLLVPIPEDIMNETDMTPQLSISEENRKIEEQLRANKKLPDKNPSVTKTVVEPEPPAESSAPLTKTEVSSSVNDEDETSKSLTDSIAEWFSNSKNKKSKENSEKNDSQSNRDQSNSIFQKLLGIGADNVTPTELKLSFQPNRAEISGQTLEWLHAFSDNAVKYDNVLVEIRLSKTAPYELQQKRLKLLYRILANNGVEYNKVNIIFTDREPNSFIIRNVRYATEEEQQKALAAKTYSPWY